MGDIQWGRAWPWMRLEMPHSYSQELEHRLENWPTLPQIQWQFKRVKGPLPKLQQDHRVKVRETRTSPCESASPTILSGLIPLEVALQRMCLENVQVQLPTVTPWQPSRGLEHNRHWRDQMPQSPQFPSPSPDCGFESNRGWLSTNSSMSCPGLTNQTWVKTFQMR